MGRIWEIEGKRKAKHGPSIKMVKNKTKPKNGAHSHTHTHTFPEKVKRT